MGFNIATRFSDPTTIGSLQTKKHDTNLRPP
jgi:hypothetical protein